MCLLTTEIFSFHPHRRCQRRRTRSATKSDKNMALANMRELTIAYQSYYPFVVSNCPHKLPLVQSRNCIFPGLTVEVLKRRRDKAAKGGAFQIYRMLAHDMNVSIRPVLLPSDVSERKANVQLGIEDAAFSFVGILSKTKVRRKLAACLFSCPKMNISSAFETAPSTW